MKRNLKGCKVEFVHNDQIIQGTVAETLLSQNSESETLHYVMLTEPVTIRYDSDPVWIVTVKDAEIMVLS